MKKYNLSFKSIFSLLFLLALIIPTLMLVKESQETRRQAKEGEEQAGFKKAETVSVLAGKNENEKLELSAKNGMLRVVFEKGTLDAVSLAGRKIEMKYLPLNIGNDLARVNLKITQAEGFSAEKRPKEDTTDRTSPEDEGNRTTNSFSNEEEDVKKRSDLVEQNRKGLDLGDNNKRNNELLFSQAAISEKRDYFTLSYDYSSLNETYAPSSLKINYFDNKGNWISLPTTVDYKKNIITAQVNHFSDFSVSGQKAQVFAPTIKNWETDLYTGAVTYSLPIETLPGKGGVSPSFSVSYNSNRANGLAFDQKGSWLGPGWDLTTAEVRFDEYNEEGSTNCDEVKGLRKRGPQYSLALSSISTPLIWIGDEGGEYGKFIGQKGGIRAKGYYGNYKGNTTFGDSCRNKIITRWIITGGDGTTYTFDVNYQPGNGSIADRKVKDVYVPTKYGLNETVNLSGIKISYYYEPEVNYGHNISTYLKEVSYNFDEKNEPWTRIEFHTKSIRELPAYLACPDDNCRNGLLPQFEPDTKYEEINFETRKLTEIAIYGRLLNGSSFLRHTTYRFELDNVNYFISLKRINVFKNGEPTEVNRLVSSDFDYKMMPVGFNYEFLTENKSYEPVWKGCERPYGSTVWNDFANDVNTLNTICEKQRERLARAGFVDCKGGGPPHDYTSPDQAKRPNCPVSAFAGSWWGGEGGIYAAWEKVLAPMLSSVNNGYGGRVEFDYQNLKNARHEFALNKNIVTERRVKDLTGRTSQITTKFEYEANPLSDGVIPNAGGGFSRVTMLDPITNMRTTTFYYPVAAAHIKPSDKTAMESGINPNTNPYFGMPLRTVLHRFADTKDLIYSDSFISYSFIPAYDPYFGVNTPEGTENLFVNNLLTEGAGNLVPVVTDAFSPKGANYIEIPKSDSRPSFIEDNVRKNQFLHKQTQNWYDRYGNVFKKADYGNVADFPDISAKSDISTGRSVVGKWWEGENAGVFTFGLPFYPYMFVKNPVRKDPPVVSTGTPAVFSHSVYEHSENYSRVNILSLAKESYTSDTLNPTSDNQKWGLKIFRYDEDGKIRGLMTSNTIKNTAVSGSQPPSVNEVTTRTEFNSFGSPIMATDAKGAKSNTLYERHNILPIQLTSEVKDENGNLKLSIVKRIFYNDFWMPFRSIDENGVESLIDYDCIGRLSRTYKSDSNTGRPQTKPSTEYYYYDYQAEGCGLGRVRPQGSSTPPLPHLRTKNRLSSFETDDNYVYSQAIADGLGQEIQTMTLKTKVNGTVMGVAKEIFYNNRGLKDAESLPKEIAPIDPEESVGGVVKASVPTYVGLGSLDKSFYYYDELGRTTSVVDPLGNTTVTQYFGQITRSFDANNSDRINLASVKENKHNLANLRDSMFVVRAGENNSFNGIVVDERNSQRWMPGNDCANQKGVNITTNKGNLTWREDGAGGHFDVMDASGGMTTLTLTSALSCGYSCANTVWSINDYSNPPNRYENGSGCTATFNHPEGNWTRGVTFTMNRPLPTPTITIAPSPTTISRPTTSHSNDLPTYVQMEVDGLGRTLYTKTVNLKENSTTYYGMISIPVYDSVGNVTEMIMKKCSTGNCDGGSQTELLRSKTDYDHLGRKWQITDPDLGVWKFAFDENGNIVKQIDAKNQTILFKYDSLNRLVKKIYPGNARGGLSTVRNEVQNIYDQDGSVIFIGKKLKMLDMTGYSQYFYDKRGRLTRDKKVVNKMLFGKSGEESAETSYEYYDSDALKATILPTTERVVQKLNEFGQIKGVSGMSDYLKESDPPVFNKFGALTRAKYGNNLQSWNEYDILGRTKRICVGTDCIGGVNKLMDYNYPTRDAIGNILTINNSVSDPSSAFTLNYSYDSRSQLLSATGKYNASYQYDALQNMLAKSEGGVNIAMQYNDLNHKHAPKVVNGFTYVYDANGNLTQDEVRDYIWDYDNKPVKIVMRASKAYSEFAYDGDGNRVLKKDVYDSKTPVPTLTIKPSPSPTPIPKPIGRRGWNNKINNGFRPSKECSVFSQKVGEWLPIVKDYTYNIPRTGVSTFIRCNQ